MMVQTRSVLLVFAMIMQQSEISAKGVAEEDYISCLQRTVTQSRAHLPALSQSAEQAAGEFLAGGNLWVAGRQADFMAEACERAGGLMSMTRLADHVPAKHDVVLYAVPGSPDERDRKMIEEWRGKGAMVITFSSDTGLFRSGVPVDTVENIVELWMWTGEFAAACTRLGKMPVFYQSYGLPGGYERAKKYQGKRFHDDLSIGPIAAGKLGTEYAEQIQRMVARIQENEMSKIERAAGWWSKAKSATILVTGHIFPVHGQDARTRQVGEFVRAPAREDKALLGGNPPEFVFYLGYQFAPQKLIEETKVKGVKLVYTDVQPGQPAEPSENILYIDPGWPLSDRCVSVPGYDVAILPASGVAQAAIYWTIVSRSFPDGRGPVLKHPN